MSDGQFHDSHGNYIGSIRSNGEMYDEHGDFMGRIDSSGHLYDEHGDYVGAVWANGYIYINGSYVGQIWEDGQVYVNGSYAGRVSGFDMPGMTTNKSKKPEEKNNPDKGARESPPPPRRPTGGNGSSFFDDEYGCLGALVAGGIVLSVLVTILIYAIAIAIMLAMVAGLIAVVGVIVYYIINAVKHGEFAKNPNAKKISGVIASVIVGIGLFIAYRGGYLEYFVGSPNNNTVSSSQNVQYEDNESDYDEYDNGDVSGNDYEEEDDSDSGNDYVEEDNNNSDSSNYYSDDDYDSEDESYSTVSADDAEFGPVQLGNHTYAIFNYKDLGLSTWQDCVRYCEDNGGHLATISDAEENRELYNYICSCGLKTAMFGLRNYAYLEGSGYYGEDDWGWVFEDGSSYRNWSSGQPNRGANNKSGEPEPCVEFYKESSDGTWNDASFGANTWRFICEWE